MMYLQLLWQTLKYLLGFWGLAIFTFFVTVVVLIFNVVQCISNALYYLTKGKEKNDNREI